ncbi:transcriptional regulator [Thomasclavelia sp.]
MKNKIIDYSKVFESIIRVQMLSSLFVSNLTYNELKEICNCSDGNMATHTKKLLAEKFIISKKEFVNNKSQTTYILTEKGKKEFLDYIKLLNSLVEQEEKI